MEKLKKGDKLYYIRGKKIKEATIEKVGRKYIYLEKYSNKIKIDTLREDSMYRPNTFYRTRAEPGKILAVHLMRNEIIKAMNSINAWSHTPKELVKLFSAAKKFNRNKGK